MQDRNTIIVGTFDDRSAAERAIEQLRDAGFHRDQIGFAGKDGTGETVLVEEHGNAAGSGAAGGLVTGAVAGGALAWLGLAAIPAIGPFLAGGAIGTALVGAAAGGITGGVLGGLLGLGIPRHKAEYHEQQVQAGRTLVTVQTAEPAIAERIFSGAGAVDIDRGRDDEPYESADNAAADPAADSAVDAAAVHPVDGSSRAFGVEPGRDSAFDDRAEPMAVPEHELRETDAYREAGVAPTPAQDTLDEGYPRAAPVGAAAPRSEVTGGVREDELVDRERPIR
jgi:hypothetical protein